MWGMGNRIRALSNCRYAICMYIAYFQLGTTLVHRLLLIKLPFPSNSSRPGIYVGGGAIHLFFSLWKPTSWALTIMGIMTAGLTDLCQMRCDHHEYWTCSIKSLEDAGLCVRHAVLCASDEQLNHQASIVNSWMICTQYKNDDCYTAGWIHYISRRDGCIQLYKVKTVIFHSIKKR